MEKIYSQNSNKKSLKPKKRTISFLLNYSKSLEVIKTKKHYFMFHLN
jgi:hypothetical protein